MDELKEVKIIAGLVVGCGVLAFGVVLMLWYGAYLAGLTTVLLTLSAAALVAKQFAGAYWAWKRPPTIFDTDKKTARAIGNADGSYTFLERDIYPAGLTNLTTHYDPRITTREVPALPPVVVDAEPPALPGMTDLASVLTTFAPSREGILLGLAPTGPVTCSLKGLSHVALAAPTGNGKSSILRMLMAQLGALGAHMWLCDPHYTPLDPDSGEDWRPLAARLAQPPFTKPTHIAHVVNNIVGEMRRRYELRERGELWNGSAYLIMEELPAILSGLEKEAARQFVKDYSDLLREARKVGIYLIAVAQDWLADTIGTDGGEIRSNLRTAFFAGGGIGTARALLDRNVKLPDDVALGKGIVLLRSAEAMPTPSLVRVPYASNDALYRLLPMQRHEDASAAFSLSLSPEPTPEPAKVAPPPARKREKTETEQILEWHAQGLKPYQIAAAMGRGSYYTARVKQVLAEQVVG